MTSGPFTRYNDIKDALFGGEVRWSLERLQFGLQRFLWGLFKKLVVAERLAIIVGTIYDTKPLPLQEDIYVGLMVVLGAFAYVALLYMDFSGCMDMVIGVSEMLGIPLAENFRRPFSATSLSEIWRKWHITLGLWLKDYIMYPLQKTLTARVGGKFKQWFGKKIGKDLVLYFSMLVLWFGVGFWHGGSWKYICASGLFFFVMIVGGMILQPVFDLIVRILRIDTTAYSWTLFGRVRSFCLFAMSVSFGRRESLTDGLRAWKTVFTDWNPWVLVDDTIFRLGLDRKDFDVMVLGLVAVVVVSMLQEHYGSVRQLIAKQNLVFRWIVYLALLFAVLIFGCYGPGYNPADFIYGGF
jgi:D-alanyl-lipoteichoic acid acyltransferase DltB (MBOAT superfamily)